jgi:hypothetical protein
VARQPKLSPDRRAIVWELVEAGWELRRIEWRAAPPANEVIDAAVERHAKALGAVLELIYGRPDISDGD